jgi:YbbR domain-containing protein
VAVDSRAPRASLVSRVFTQNLGLKLVALMASVLLFSVVHNDVDAQRSMVLDVVALLPPPSSGKLLISELPAQVRVTFRGSRSRLNSLSRDELSPLQMDLRDYLKGDASTAYYYLDPRMIEVGSNVHVTEITPAMVPLTWAVAGERRVPVQVQLEGELPKTLSLRSDVEVDTAYVTLRGPEQALRTLTTVSTEPVSLVGLGLGEHRRRVPLEPLPDHVAYVEDSAVEVRLIVDPAMAERTLRRLEVAALGEGSVSLRPDHVEVTLRGPQDLIDELEPDVIVPYVALDPTAQPGTHSADVQLRGVPAGVTVVRILPPSTLVWLKGKR